MVKELVSQGVYGVVVSFRVVWLSEKGGELRMTARMLKYVFAPFNREVTVAHDRADR
jgi:hypothetical protein